jgi:cold-inducible RNA-binding protein
MSREKEYCLMNIYVGNLSYNVDDQALGDMFAQYGEVTSAKVIMDRDTRRSKGFGFVEMPDQTQAEAAIQQLNGQVFDGRNLKVNVSQPKEERSRRRF